MRILESERAERENIDEHQCNSLKQKREAQMFSILAELKQFLDRYGIDKQTPFEKRILLEKALELDRKYYDYRHCYYNVASNGVHSSVNVSAMIAEKMQYSFDYDAHGHKTKFVKKNPKFINRNGEPDFRTLSAIRQIENADDNLHCSYDDIADLGWANNFRKLSDRAKFLNNKSLNEKAKSPLNDYYVEFTD